MIAQAKTGALPEIRVPAALTFAGLVVGLLVGLLMEGSDWLGALLAIAEPIGKLWLQALKMTILPLVAGLLFTGIAQTVATARAGAMARRTLGLFLAVLAASAAIGALVMPLLLKWVPIPAQAMAAFGKASAVTGPVPDAGDFLAGLIPENIFKAASDGAMLPFIVFIALFALASTRLPERPRVQLAGLFEALAGTMMVVIGWILALAPIGVFALALGLAAHSGAAAIGALAHYVILVAAIGAAVLVGGYVLGIVGGRKRPMLFTRALLPSQAVAFSTQSSLASLPAMLISTRLLGLKDTSGEFVLPLAVALFRATSPAMNLAVAIYVAKLAGVELEPQALLAGAGVALLVSLGTVSLPGTISFIASIAPIAIAMGVPVEPLALLVAVEVLPDIMRTVGNVTMDVAVTAVADRSEGAVKAG